MPVQYTCPYCGVLFLDEPSIKPIFCSLGCADRSREEARVWANVDRSRPDGCWPWTGKSYTNGYGVVSYQGTATPAHRAIWRMVNGDIPDGLWVLHLCNNRACCRPDHLELGDQSKNMRYMVACGRHGAVTKPESIRRGPRHWHRHLPERRPYGDRNGSRTHPERLKRGEQNARAKLTAEIVIEMRAQFAAGEMTQTALAKKFGVSSPCVSQVVRRKVWKHV